MAYDPGLAERIRETIADRSLVTERKMFGGLAFMHRGHVFVGVLGSALMVRVGPAGYRKALGRAHVREMDFTGRPMAGYVFVDPPGLAEEAALQAWIAAGLAFVDTLPGERVGRVRVSR